MTSERRADERFKLQSPVEVAGIDTSGAQFHEQTRIEDVSDAGCRLSLRHSVQRGALVAIKPLGESGEDHPEEYWRPFVVIWAKRHGAGITAGVRGVLESELMDIGLPPGTAIAKGS